MRSLNRAIWTSGLPVSVGWVPYWSITDFFCSLASTNLVHSFYFFLFRCMCLRVTRGRAGCKDWVVKLFTPSTMQKTRVITCQVMIDRFILTSRFFSFTVLAQPVITSPSPVFSTCVKVDLPLTTPDAKRPRPVKTLGADLCPFEQTS